MSRRPETANDSGLNRRTLLKGLEAGAPEKSDLENRTQAKNDMVEFMKNRTPAPAGQKE